MEQEEGVSIGGIFRTIGKRIWIVLAAAIVCALAAVLLTALVVNPAKSKCSMEFAIVYPTDSTQQYPDGSPFTYRDLISYDVLEEAKNSNETFKSLDVKDMLKEDDITVSPRTDGDGNAFYTLSVKTSRFKNKDAAERYIRAVADTITARIRTNASGLEYGIDAETFHNASLSERLQILNMQKQSITKQYNQWMEIYSESYRVNGKTLANYLADVSVVYGESVQSALKREAEMKGFGELNLNGYETVKEAIEAFVNDLKDEKTFNLKLIEELRKDYSGETSGTRSVKSAETQDGSNVIVMPADKGMSEMLAFYLKRNAEIDYQLDIFTEDPAAVEPVVKEKPVTDFSARIEREYTSLSEAAKTLSEVSASIYKDDTYALFSSQNVTVSGGIGMMIVVLGVFVLAFLAGVVIAYFVGRKKKAEPQKEAAETNPEENKPEE